MSGKRLFKLSRETVVVLLFPPLCSVTEEEEEASVLGSLPAHFRRAEWHRKRGLREPPSPAF